MIEKKTIKNVNVKNKTVFLRCDFNVPLKDSKILDDTRIVESLKTIKYLIDNNAKIILCSHLGSPKGIVKKELSLIHVKERLSELLNKKIIFTNDDFVISKFTKEVINKMNFGDIILLENIRFRKEEMENDENFSKELAFLCDIYVNDAFGASHRKHASINGIAKFSKVSVLGFLIEKEINFIKNVLISPKKPTLAIVGGLKVSSKINIITTLIEKFDSLIICGAMAYTFLRAKGIDTANSFVEEDYIDTAIDIINKSKDNIKLILPIDNVLADSISNTANIKICPSDKDFDEGYIGLDIGPKSIELFKTYINKAKTIIWNGPVGFFEIDKFNKGTFEIAKSIADSNAISIVGGGDSISAVNKCGVNSKISHISTGGGATLEFLKNENLAGIEYINNK